MPSKKPSSTTGAKRTTRKTQATEQVADLEVPKVDENVRGGMTTLTTMATKDKTLLTGAYDDYSGGTYTCSADRAK